MVMKLHEAETLLARALASIETSEEAMALVLDLMTPREVVELARRQMQGQVARGGILLAIEQEQQASADPLRLTHAAGEIVVERSHHIVIAQLDSILGSSERRRIRKR